MILAEHFPRNGPLHFQANNIPALLLTSFSCNNTGQYVSDVVSSKSDFPDEAHFF